MIGYHPVLFHGSRYPRAIIQSDRIKLPTSGYRMISLTRDIRVARHWACLRRDDDEGVGAILVLDRQKLRTRYRIEPFRDEAWHTGFTRSERDEAEEIVYGRPIDGLSGLLVEVRWIKSAC